MACVVEIDCSDKMADRLPRSYRSSMLVGGK